MGTAFETGNTAEFLSSGIGATDTTPPTFSGITSLTQNLDGSLQADWSAASDISLPIHYEIYIQAETATGLFTTSPMLAGNTSKRIATLSDETTILQPNTTYYVGVRAVDGVGNRDTNSVSLSITLTYANYNSLIATLLADPKFLTVGKFLGLK